jgi:hypothetical protein
VAAGMPVGLDRRALVAEPALERLGCGGRADRVALAGGDEGAGRDGGGIGRPRDQRVHEDGQVEERGAREDHAREDVCAVRVAEADDLRGLRLGDVGLDERGHLRGGAGEVGHVVAAFGEAAEEARVAALRDVAAGGDQAGAGHQGAGEVEELRLVAAGAVEEEDEAPAGGAFGVVVVGVDHRGHSVGANWSSAGTSWR